MGPTHLPLPDRPHDVDARVELDALVGCDPERPRDQRCLLGVAERLLADDAGVSLRSSRQKFPAPGMSGGKPGGLGTFIRNPGAATQTRLGMTTSGTPFANGDVLRVLSPGGGGYGDPRERDRAAVKRDLIEGKITAQAAREIYGLLD